MAAELLIDERHVLDARAFVEIVVWRLPRPARDSRHSFKYRLAFVVDEICVLRYDNESGKGDHRHIKGREEQYEFISVEKLRQDFEADIRKYGGVHEKKD